MLSQESQGQSLKEIYTHNTRLPNRRTSFAFWFIAIFIGTLLTQNLYASLILIGWGIFSAYIWRKVGWAITYRTYISPLRRMRELQMSDDVPNRFLRLVFGSDIKRAFLQFETVDIDISSLRKILRTSTRTFISFIALTTTIARVLLPYVRGEPSGNATDEFGEYLEIIGPALIIGFILAFPLLAIYLPQALITEDARVMVIHEDGAIRYAGSKIRNTLDSFFGITGVLSGFDIIRNELGINVQSILGFALIIILGAVVASPILFPTLLIYYRKHSEYVNKFREEATKAKIYPARTTINPLSTDEIQALVLGDVRPVHEVVPATLIGKMKQLVAGPKFEYPKLSEEEIRGIELKGAWVCRTCYNIHPSGDENKFCTQCGTRRVTS
ncbi:MAG: hypothetical protein ACXAB7_03200 [Candidatus Kariarchaeaceae archaeon]|jgi:NADH:ubiquinone oxidoreductase subunit 6 (subunit J)